LYFTAFSYHEQNFRTLPTRGRFYIQTSTLYGPSKTINNANEMEKTKGHKETTPYWADTHTNKNEQKRIK
jgi:hypothetical protein